jgi:hypothetical protein
VEKDGRLDDLSGVYREMDDNQKKKMEELAEGLLKVQLIIEGEKKDADFGNKLKTV